MADYMPDWMIYALVSISSIAVTIIVTGWKGYSKAFGAKTGEVAAIQENMDLILEQTTAIIERSRPRFRTTYGRGRGSGT
jgi:hypothetical protein